MRAFQWCTVGGIEPARRFACAPAGSSLFIVHNLPAAFMATNAEIQRIIAGGRPQASRDPRDFAERVLKREAEEEVSEPAVARCACKTFSRFGVK